MSKQYGLIVPDKSKKSAPTFQASRNVFGGDSDSDSENKKKRLGPLRPSDNIKRQAKATQEKALIEDPTVYQYDEIYDEMTIKKKEEKIISKEDKKPRYIEKLLKSAQKRKLENERRVERQVQKEREKEGEEFADKEVFVTSAYKKKLEEMRKEEEKEKYEEYLESIGDVTKQKDLGGFYRHLYEQKLGSKNETPELAKSQDKAISDESAKTPEKNVDEQMKKSEKKSASTKKSRNYRKRKSPTFNRDLSEGEIISDDEINRLNLEDLKAAKRSRNKKEANIDADSDFSIDESSDENSSDGPHTPKIEDKAEVMHSGEPKHRIKQSEENKEKQNTKQSEEHKEKESVEENKLELLPKKELLESKIKIDIWKKRTVGEVFEQAQKRYYERKAARYRNM